MLGGIIEASGRCGNSEYKEYLYRKYPGLREAQEKKRKEDFEIDSFDEKRSSTIWTIPIIVHVIYNLPIQNISDEVIIGQIAIMNKDFRSINFDKDMILPVFMNRSADSEIQFVLTDKDPNNMPFVGITRTYTSVQVFPAPGDDNFQDACKYASEGGVDAWNSSAFMNLWVCNLGEGILGYTEAMPGYDDDGVVITSKYFGVNPQYNQVPYNYGRTVTHEMGHWLNLDHPWGVEDSNPDCLYDDYVMDTPKTNGSSFDCDLTRFSCDNLNMVQNFMDYSDDDCLQLFTHGQVTRMRRELPDGNQHTRQMAFIDNGYVPGITDQPVTTSVLTTQSMTTQPPMTTQLATGSKENSSQLTYTFGIAMIIIALIFSL